jgi:hypothetical protein
VANGPCSKIYPGEDQAAITLEKPVCLFASSLPGKRHPGTVGQLGGLHDDIVEADDVVVGRPGLIGGGDPKRRIVVGRPPVKVKPAYNGTTYRATWTA